MTLVATDAIVETVQQRAGLVSFDPAAHRYARRADGVPVVSVTQAIDGAGFMDKTFMRDRTERGRIVHAATLAYEQGLLDMDEVPDDHRGYVESFALTYDEVRPSTVLAEQVLYSPQIGVAGALDRLWLVGGVYEVTDFKAGTEQPWHQVQTAAYAYLIDPLGWVRQRSTWLLKKSGRPAKRIPHEDYANDTADFLAAVRCHHWRTKHVA